MPEPKLEISSEVSDIEATIVKFRNIKREGDDELIDLVVQARKNLQKYKRDLQTLERVWYVWRTECHHKDKMLLWEVTWKNKLPKKERIITGKVHYKVSDFPPNELELTFAVGTQLWERLKLYRKRIPHAEKAYSDAFREAYAAGIPVTWIAKKSGLNINNFKRDLRTRMEWWKLGELRRRPAQYIYEPEYEEIEESWY